VVAGSGRIDTSPLDTVLAVAALVAAAVAGAVAATADAAVSFVRLQAQDPHSADFEHHRPLHSQLLLPPHWYS